MDLKFLIGLTVAGLFFLSGGGLVYLVRRLEPVTRTRIQWLGLPMALFGFLGLSRALVLVVGESEAARPVPPPIVYTQDSLRGFGVVVDPETGCQYMFLNPSRSLSPRLDSLGKPWCRDFPAEN